MRAAWSTDLLLSIDRDATSTLRAQLERQLRATIDVGRLQVDTVMPSSRELASWLGLSRGVVVEAYEQLVAEGYLVSRRGSGTRVGQRPVLSAREAIEVARMPEFEFDFKPGVPDLALFPRRVWASCLKEATMRATAVQLGYSDPRGDESCRRALVDYLARSRAVTGDPANVVMCSGFTQGIDLVARVFTEKGVRRVAIEDPSFGGLAANLRSLGLDVVHIPVDDEGLDVTVLAHSSAQAVVLAPAHQFPTGAALSARRRTQLLDWARCRQAWVVEDDYDAEFRYDQERMPALQGQAPERVIYIGTVSKILSPALRLGWMFLPGDLAASVALMKRRVDRGGPAIEQIAFARMLESGAVDRHLRTARIEYRRRREILVQALSHGSLAARTRGAAAGLHVMVELPVDVDEALVVREARHGAVRVFGGAAYRRDRSEGAGALVLGFGGIAQERIADGVAKLAGIIARCRGSNVRSSSPGLQCRALVAIG